MAPASSFGFFQPEPVIPPSHGATTSGFASLSLLLLLVPAMSAGAPRFRRVRTQFIAALGDPGRRAGSAPRVLGDLACGPRASWVRLKDARLIDRGKAPANWAFDPQSSGSRSTV